MEETQVALFKLKDYECGVETTNIKTIIKHQKATSIKGAPKYVEGIVRWRDMPVLVINLPLRLELGKTGLTKKTKIIIVEICERLLGLTVDDVSLIKKYSTDEIEPAPPVIINLKTGYLKAVGKSEEKLVPVLDFEKILSKQEMERLDSIVPEITH